MIPDLPGWTRDTDGDALVLFPDGDRSTGFIRYLERLGPVAAPLDLLAAQLARDPQFAVDELSPVEDLVTAEGEYAAMVTIAGRLGDQAAHRAIGWVYGDLHVARVSGMTVDPAARDRFTAAVRDLLIADEQHLGVRRRRFRHAVPIGWSAAARGFATTVYRAPSGGAQIEVSPALPSYAGLRDVERRLDAMDGTGGVTIEQRLAPESVTVPGGLAGRVWQLTCRQGPSRFVRRFAALADDRYLYCLRLDSTADSDRGRAVFDEVVRSVEPIPTSARRQTRAVAAEVVSHWC